MKLKWFAFDQNNSGGRFVHDDNVAECVFIQDVTAKRAVSRAEEFCDNSDSCPCCGDRWSIYVVCDDDGTDEPSMYDKTIWAVEPNRHRKQAKLHYFDGTVVTYTFGDPKPDAPVQP